MHEELEPIWLTDFQRRRSVTEDWKSTMTPSGRLQKIQTTLPMLMEETKAM